MTKPPDKFRQDLESLQEKLLSLANLAEAAIFKSIKALTERNPDLARQVIQGDKAVNDLEELIDADCVRLVALYQPVAVDLRQVMAADHVIVELERVGDLAVNISEEALEVGRLPTGEFHLDLLTMAEMVLKMLRQALSAFMNRDAAQAREVCLADGEVDALDRAIVQELLGSMCVVPEAVGFHLSQISVARHLERVGDHATNIAEQVVYMVEGESIRHRCQG